MFERPLYPTDSQQTKLKFGQPDDRFEQQAERVADTVMRMPDNQIRQQPISEEVETVQMQTTEEKEELQMQQHAPAIKMKCKECEEEEKMQMKPAVQMQRDGQNYASPGITKQLNASKGNGTPLSSGIRKMMSNKMGADFNNVNVHTDSKAVQMNRALGARAFTHGNDIYFNRSQYKPDSPTGMHLLAHELTHVVQQRKTQPDNNSEVALPCIQRITCRNTSGRQPARTPQGESNRLDTRATRILAIAGNSDYSNQQKANRLLTAIICHYYNPQAAKVHSIHYDDDLSAGLRTQSVGRGSNARGKIFVSNQFIRDTTPRYFARRVLQVGHELQHINQYRQGLTGGRNQNEREFLAFYENALADEFEGTGRMSRGTRRNLIDAALGYYYCLSAEKKREYRAYKNNLLQRRRQINRRAGRGPTSPPDSCRRQ